MKLLELRIEPRQPGGWSSSRLEFGKAITELYGPNGCGKTPLIQAVVYALGYPIKFRDDIYEKCDSAVLVLEHQGGAVQFKRRIQEQFDVFVEGIGEGARQFYDEREFSLFVLELLGFQAPTLTTTNNDPVTPYLAHFLPLFYVDQDHGYSNAYYAPSVFVKDQYVEMMRLAFGIAPKHSYDQKKQIFERQRRIDGIDRTLVSLQDSAASLAKEIGTSPRVLAAIDEDIAVTRTSLASTKANAASGGGAASDLDVLRQNERARQNALRIEMTEVAARADGLEAIRAEIELELNTLSLNEDARRLFGSFSDICANPACGLFIGSSDSYGKSLLYLRDQLKDLDSTVSDHRSRAAVLAGEVRRCDETLAELDALLVQERRRSGLEGAMEATARYTTRLLELQQERLVTSKLEENGSALLKLVNERERLLDEVASLSGSRGETDLRSILLRTSLREAISRWLDVLDTKNVSREIRIDTDFKISFGAERLRQFKGSTLLRVVLALHAAIFEVYLQDKARRLRLMILDTPRQQDIERDALANYVLELKSLAARSNAQIIFSTTDYHYDCDENDSEWLPSFPGTKQPMLLG